MYVNDDKDNPKVSIIIIALNEEKALPKLLNDIQNQTYDHKKIEIILVDSMSTDNTYTIMKKFKNNNDFYNIICKKNPLIIQASGWNVALNNISGEIIIRLDAHASIPQDFVKKNVIYIKKGYDICGGRVKNYIPKSNKWTTVVNMAENSMFGGSIAAFRHKDQAGFVNTLAFAAYKREVFETVGFFNEQLVRTEDNEMHYRMRKAGYKFYYTPEIVSVRETRPNFRKLLRQKILNGYWIGLTLKICPKCFSIYHFIPLLFVCGIVLTTLLASIGWWQLAAMMWGLYFSFNIVMSIMACLVEKEYSLYCFFLPILFLLLQTGYGIGSMVGIIMSPWKIKNLKDKSRS